MNPTPSILIVEDEAALVTLLRYNLERAGFENLLTRRIGLRYPSFKIRRDQTFPHAVDDVLIQRLKACHLPPLVNQLHASFS